MANKKWILKLYKSQLSKGETPAFINWRNKSIDLYENSSVENCFSSVEYDSVEEMTYAVEELKEYEKETI